MITQPQTVCYSTEQKAREQAVVLARKCSRFCALEPKHERTSSKQSSLCVMRRQAQAGLSLCAHDRHTCMHLLPLLALLLLSNQLAKSQILTRLGCVHTNGSLFAANASKRVCFQHAHRLQGQHSSKCLRSPLLNVSDNKWHTDWTQLVANASCKLNSTALEMLKVCQRRCFTHQFGPSAIHCK